MLGVGTVKKRPVLWKWLLTYQAVIQWWCRLNAHECSYLQETDGFLNIAFVFADVWGDPPRFHPSSLTQDKPTGHRLRWPRANLETLMWGKLECLVQTHVDPREQAGKSEANLPTMVLYGCCGNRCTVMDCNCNLLVKFGTLCFQRDSPNWAAICTDVFFKRKKPTLSFISLKKKPSSNVNCCSWTDLCVRRLQIHISCWNRASQGGSHWLRRAVLTAPGRSWGDNYCCQQRHHRVAFLLRGDKLQSELNKS